ncbi:MAG: alpha-L-glutamate ligase-like protein [Deltaproteobacteria bacterium]|nr:alpha-L-glutamate ligase-like protein [Deltaproteobacteria bacterium]
MGSLIARLQRLRREVLGLNRRNQECLAVLNAPRLIGLVDHKGHTKQVLQQHGLPVPETFGCYTRQRELVLLAREVDRHPEFVLKPARGAGGEGVVVIAGRAAGRLLKASGTSLRPADLVAHAADIIAGAFSLSQARDEALLEHRLAPEPTLAAFSPGGIPDVRVLVVRGVPLMAMLRLPTRRSDGRANLHVGGIGVGLALPEGRAVHAIWRDRSITRHPDTEQPLAGVRVPAWDDILALAARSYEAIPLGYFGIDIVIDAKLGPAILELNARPGLGIQLANRCGLRSLLDAVKGRDPGRLTWRERVVLGLELVERRGAG